MTLASIILYSQPLVGWKPASGCSSEEVTPYPTILCLLQTTAPQYGFCPFPLLRSHGATGVLSLSPLSRPGEFSAAVSSFLTFVIADLSEWTVSLLRFPR